MNRLIGSAAVGAAAFLALAGAAAGGYVMHHPETRTITHTAIVTKTAAPAKTAVKPAPKVTATSDAGLVQCAVLLRNELETYAAFETANAGYPSAADGFTPDDNICSPYVEFGTQYAMVQPPSQSAVTPSMPHVNGATHSQLENCSQVQCTTLPGAGPNGGTCGPVVNNEQECVW